MCERGEERGEWAVPLQPSLGLLVNRVSTERVVRSNIEVSSVRSVVSTVVTTTIKAGQEPPVVR